LNDEINKLLREKRHWENQIVALGGANYRRNVAMLDDDGKEVPGTKGYKYFGRAKELPGVKELFMSRKKEDDEENAIYAYYKKFVGHGPSYFGDTNEADGTLLEYELDAEEADWEEAHLKICVALGLPVDEDAPKMPRYFTKGHDPSTDKLPHNGQVSVKRKVPDEGGGEEPVNSEETDVSKRVKMDTDGPAAATQTVLPEDAAKAVKAYIPFLDVRDLIPPKMPTREELEGVLLKLRKEALMSEYFGGVNEPQA